MSNVISNLNDTVGLPSRWLHLVWQGLLFLVIYYLNLHYAVSQESLSSAITNFDKKIPNIRWMIVPYSSSVVLFIFAFLRQQSRLSLCNLSVQTTIATLCSGYIFLFMPLSYGDTVDYTSDLWSPLYSLLHELDKPYNQLPSLHVVYAIVFCNAIWPKRSLLKVFIFLYSGLLISSTLFTKQHHLFDVLSGALLAIIILFLVRKFPIDGKVNFYFSTALVMLFIGRIFVNLLPFLGYLCMLFLLLAYCYSSKKFPSKLLGKNTDGKIPLYTYILLLPYFCVYYFLWCWRKFRETNPYIHVSPTLFCGRQLTSSERQFLPKNCRCIDLGCELNSTSDWLDYKSMPLLDLVEINSEQMLPICHQIRVWQHEYPNDNIYVHCTMGISRSIATVLCYSSFKGENVEKLKQRILRERPQTHMPEHYLSQETLKIMRDNGNG